MTDPRVTGVPDEARCLAALRAVQGLPPDAFERTLTEEIGTPMIQVMHSVLRALHPDDTDDEAHKKLHLMLISYLLARRA